MTLTLLLKYRQSLLPYDVFQPKICFASHFFFLNVSTISIVLCALLPLGSCSSDASDNYNEFVQMSAQWVGSDDDITVK